MLKIKDSVDLKELEKYGFKKDSYNPSKIEGEYDYTYEFLRIDISNREVFLSSGVDEINGDLEILKLYDLIKADMVEKVEDDE